MVKVRQLLVPLALAVDRVLRGQRDRGHDDDDHDEHVEQRERHDGVDGAPERVGRREDEHGGVGEDWRRLVAQVLLLGGGGGRGGAGGGLLRRAALGFLFPIVDT